MIIIKCPKCETNLINFSYGYEGCPNPECEYRCSQAVLAVHGKDAVIYTEEELRSKCAEWQKILRLQDWIVNVRIKRRSDMSDGNFDAQIHVTLPNRVATIYILDPIDYDSRSELPQDMEQHLVHELLHIHLYPITGKFEEGLLQIAEEQAIEAISWGLIALKRGGEGERFEVPAHQKFEFTSPGTKVEAEGPVSVLFVFPKQVTP